VDYRLIHGDCLEVLPTLADNSIDLVLTDPPYHRVKGEAWDRQWKTDADYLDWLGRVLAEFQRVLKPNGSLYLFASPRMAARVEVKTGERFRVLTPIVWRKPFGRHNQADVEVIRAYFPQTERIIFAEHYGADNIAKGEAGYVAKCDELRGFVFEPLRAYLDGERQRAGIDKEDINEALGFRRLGGMAGRHYFSQSQWQLPTAEHYTKMRELFNRNGGEYLRREYEDLRREYEDLRREYEDLRRPFRVTADVPYTDVWDFPTVKAYPGKHVCEKPVALLSHIIQASSKPGAVVLDAFMGSGASGEAAVKLGRQYIGIELDSKWVERATFRIRGALARPTVEVAPVAAQQARLAV
jgi:site-specific DNA-methyltransferase (adenine-specific)